VSARSITLAPLLATTKPPKPGMAARSKLRLGGPILPTLLRLSAPNVLNLLAIAGMITFDGLFSGRLGADALAGVSLAFPFVMLIQHTAASGMGGGVSSAIARALGAGKRDVANALVLHTLVLALGWAAVFSTVLLLVAPTVFRCMGGHGTMLTAAMNDANVAFSAANSICMLNLLGSAVRGTGNMALPAARACPRAVPSTSRLATLPFSRGQAHARCMLPSTDSTSAHPDGRYRKLLSAHM
jgi:Na+-driven multidrug efflux pump